MRCDRRSFLRLGAAGGALAAVGGMATTQGWLAPAQATAAPEERTAFTYQTSIACVTACCSARCVTDAWSWCNRARIVTSVSKTCLKGISEIEHIYGEARVQSPMRRVGNAAAVSSR